MLDIFLYNENFGIVLINYIIIDNLSLNFFLESKSTFDFFWFDNYYFDNIFFQKNKKYYYSWTTTSDAHYFVNKRILNSNFFFSYIKSFFSHRSLYEKSYIFWHVQKIISLTFLDYHLKNVFLFLNFANNNTFFFYNLHSYWDFFFDVYFNLYFFDLNYLNWNYYTIFDFKKNFIGISAELLSKKFIMLYYYKNVNQISMFFSSLDLEIFELLHHFNSYGVFLQKNSLFSNFISFKYFLLFIFDLKNFFFKEFFFSNDFTFFYEKKGLVFYFRNYDFFKYIFELNYIKLDIFLNNFPVNDNIFYILNDYFRFNKLVDTSISNIYLYSYKSDLLPLYSLELTKSGKFFNEIYLNNNIKDMLSISFLSKENILNYLFDDNLNTNYFFYFYKHININPFLFFIISDINSTKILFFIIFGFFIIFSYFINLVYNIFDKDVIFFIFSDNFLIFFLNWILSKLNYFFLIIILFLNLLFKGNLKYFINKEFILSRWVNMASSGSFFNFDLILFIYYKIIYRLFGYNYHDNFNLLRSEFILLDFFFLIKNLLFLLIILFFIFIFYIFFIFNFINFFLLINIYNNYYLFYDNLTNIKYSLELNKDGSSFLIWNWTTLYTYNWYFIFMNFWLKYSYNHSFFKRQLLNFFVFKLDEKELLKNMYVRIKQMGFFLFWEYSTIFISLLHKRDLLIRFRYFFVDRFNYEIRNDLKDWNINLKTFNLWNTLRFLELRLGVLFLNLDLFKVNEKIYVLDYSLLNLLKEKKKNYISSNIYFNIEFENIILKPLNKIFKYIFFSNIIFLFFFCTTFLKFFKLEIYIKLIFFYIFNFLYLIFSYFFNKNFLKIINFKKIYFLLFFFYKLKYFIFIFFEILINKIFLNILNFLKKFKILLISFLFIYCCLNINFFSFNVLINIIFQSQIFIYIYLCFSEFIFYIFESLFIQNFFNKLLFFSHNFLSWNDIDIYFLNYKMYIFSWWNILKEYYLSFEYMSTRKAYGINFKLLMFNEYKDSFYAWIPHSFVHTFVRFIYVVFLEKEPELWFYGMKFFDNYFRLGWDFVGLHLAKRAKLTVMEHVVYGFFYDSIYHKYYLGYDLLNLLYYYNFYILEDYFKNQLLLYIFYYFLYIYFIIEYFFFYFNILFCFLLNNIIQYFYVLFVFFFKWIIWFLSLFYYVFLYFFYNFYFFFEKFYIFFYTFFFFNIFFNLFLFLYNFFIYYQVTLFDFLNMDIDFIKQNIFNFKYKLIEDWHPLGVWLNYIYKFEQYTWVANIFKEYFIRNLFIYELKNLHFFNTFYSFYMNINRITFFFFFIYLFILYKILQYLLLFINKWFFFTFFNNDWSVSRNPSFTWDRWRIFDKNNSYYFNEGFNHILGGNIIWNYFYYFNNSLDTYIYEKKNFLLYPEKVYNINENEKKKDYDNTLFFRNQVNITKSLWKKNYLNNNFFNWNIISFLFFKNYQFLWYKNLDFIILKYQNLYGNFSRPWIEHYNNKNITSLWIDKYNYLFLPANGRVAFTSLFTRDWYFYKDFIIKARYSNFSKNKFLLKKKFKLYNFISENLLLSFKKFNIDKLFYLRLQYPFLMYWITTKDIEKNNNLKYLFPLLISNKKIWSVYNDLFITEKNSIKNRASVPMSAEWLTYFNKSFFLPYLSILSRIDYNLTYNNTNYKGVWKAINNNDRDLFLNYIGWDSLLDKYPDFNYLNFYNELTLLDKYEVKYYDWLNKISQRYFNYSLNIFKMHEFFYYPKMYEQNLFKNLKYREYDFDFNLDNMDSSGTLNYFKERKNEDIEEPYTSEEWMNIFRDYQENAFFYGDGDDDVILMFLYRHYVINNKIGPLNFIYNFLFFFVPIYVYIVGTEIYFQLCSGFVFQGDLQQPINTEMVYAREYFLSMADYDMQDERYFYVNVIEQELLDSLIRFYQEIFYNFTKYFNTFDYLNLLKKSNILLHDDIMSPNLNEVRMYWNFGRLFKSYRIKAKSNHSLEESDSIWFFMQDRKNFYIFSDLSYNISFFKNINDSNNLSLLFFNYNIIKRYISELSIYGLVIFDLFKFFENVNSSILDINSVLVYKNIYNNKQNLLDFIFFSIKEVNNNNFFFINTQNYVNNFYYFFFNKNKEYTFWFDNYLIWKKNYVKISYHYTRHVDQRILPFFLYNTRVDIVDLNYKTYKISLNNVEVKNQLNILKSKYYLNDFNFNYTIKRVWRRARRAWYNMYIQTTRTYLYSVMDISWFTKLKSLPITSSYLYNFNSSSLFFNKYFLSNYLKSYTILNNYSSIYIDKSTLIMDNSKIFQFQLCLSESSIRNYFVFPFYEFILLFVLLFISLFFIFFVFLFFIKIEFLINNKIDTKNMYYDKLNDIWVYFD